MVTLILVDGSEWRGVCGDGWINTATKEHITDAEMERRLADGYVQVG